MARNILAKSAVLGHQCHLHLLTEHCTSHTTAFTSATPFQRRSPAEYTAFIYAALPFRRFEHAMKKQY